MNEQKNGISMEHPALEEFREAIETMISDAIEKMNRMGVWQASVTAKLNMEINPTMTGRQVFMKHKVTTNVPVKQEIQGQANESFLLRIETDDGAWSIVPEFKQEHMFDDLGEIKLTPYRNDEEESEEEE